MRYALGPTLGSGGMGRVLLGHDAVLQRELAVKEALSPLAAGRLRREARLLARLDHPSIVAIYDADLQVPWFAMRLVRGATLGEAIASSADLPARLRLLRHLLAACEGVAHAHAVGIIHRDLKPDNLLVSDLGETQVLDWGLAAELDRPETPLPASPTAAEPELTSAGAVLGTPRYLSPEAARGEALDRRADVWSLGVMLWQTLAGVTPWGDAQTPAILEQLRQGRSPIPPDDAEARAMARADLPVELLAISRKATAANVDRRYADARALAADLEAWLDGRRVSAHRYSRSQNLWRAVKILRLPLTVAAVGAVVVAAVLAVATARVIQERDLARAALGESQRARAGLSAAQALAAVEAGRGPEAELAAAAALQGAITATDEALARGVVAQVSAGPRMALADRRALPGCREAVVAEDGGDVLCRTDSGLAFWPAGAAAPRWRSPLGLQSAALPAADVAGWGDAADRLIVQTGNDAVQVLRRSDGQAVGPAQLGGGPRPLRLARGVAAQPCGGLLALTELTSGKQRLVPACGGAGRTVEVVAPHPREGWWLACSDGSVRLLDAQGERVVAQTALRAPLATPTALHVDGAETLWLASSKGHLLRMDQAAARASLASIKPGEALQPDLQDPLQRAATEAALARPMLSLIRQLQPAGPWLALRGDRGEVRLVDPLTLNGGATLPGAGYGPLVVQAAGAEAAPLLISAGAAVQRWSIPPASAPHLLEVAERRSVTSLCRLQDTVVVAQGTGDVEAFDARSHTSRWRSRWQGGVIKAVACDGQRGVVWAAAITDSAVVQLDGRDGRRLRQWPLPQPVRRLVARDHGWIAATIAGGLWRSDGDGPAQLLGPADGDWVDLDASDADTAARVCAVEGRSGEVVAVHALQDRAEQGQPPQDLALPRLPLPRLDLQPGVRACALRRDGGLGLVRDDALHWSGASGERWQRPLASRPADLSIDGDVVAVALLDGSAQVWHLRDGRLIAQLSGHRERVAALLFDSRDPAILWTASWDGSLRRWHGAAWQNSASSLVQAAQQRWGRAP